MKTQTQTPDLNAPPPMETKDHPLGKCQMSRRKFLLASGVTTATVMVTMKMGASLAEVPAVVATYPRKKIAKLSDLKTDKPLAFEYPDEGAYAQSMIVKLGQQAGGGIGPGRDVVAFN